MPSRFSKFFIDTTCREFSHPWTDSCISTTAGLGLHTLQECLRLYSTVYVVTLLMKGKVPSREDIKKTILGILQSAAFLSWSGFSYSMFICLLRRIFGNFNFLSVSFLPSFLSSFTAILIERPSRRTLLCLYVSNIATETLFRMGEWRGYYTPIRHGETYIFAASVALLLYYFRSKENKQDSIYKILRVIVGPYEDSEYLKRNHTYSVEEIAAQGSKDKNSKEKKKLPTRSVNILFKSFEFYKQMIAYLRAQGKNVTCPHPYGCAHYVLMNGVKMFSYGAGAQLALKLIFQIKRLFSKPRLVAASIFKKENLNLAVFLGGFASLYRLVSCLLRRYFQRDSQYYAIPAALLGSTAFMAYPGNTIALYFMWKALQLLWNDSVEKGIVPEVKWFVILLYCFSTALLFHTAIMEPQNLRPSYWKFLYNLSGGRIATMSREPLDHFGLQSSMYLQRVLKQTNTTDQHIYSF